MLGERCARAGKSQHFELLEQYDLGAGPDHPSYADLARRFGIATTDVTEIVLPGTLVGLLTGYATMRYGRPAHSTAATMR